MSARPGASPGTAGTWARRWGLRVASAALSAGLGLALGEVALRRAGPAWLRQRIELLAVESAPPGDDRRPSVERRGGKFLRFAPGSRFAMRHPEFSAVAHFDALGGRDAGVTGSGGVLPFLGDSFTFGFGVTDAESFVSLLGPRVGRRVLNLGVPGSSLPNQLDIVELRHQELGRPPLYVFGFFPGNDLADMMNYHRPPGGRAAHDPFEWLWNANVVTHTNPLLRRSYVFQLLRAGLVGLYNRGEGRAMEAFFLAASRANASYRETAVRLLDRDTAHLATLADRLAFRAVFLVIPDKNQVYPSILAARAGYYGLDPAGLDVMFPNRALTERLDRVGIPSIDLLDCMRRKGDGLYYRYDDHLTAAGQRAVAECAAPRLRVLLRGPR